MTKRTQREKTTKRNTSNFPVGDFLTRIKNAGLARKKLVEFPATGFVVAVAKSLKKEGFLEDISESKGILTATLSFRKKEPLVSDIKIISKPGLRLYKKVEDLEVLRGPSIFIISTPGGVMSSKDAIKKRLGGEVLAEIL